jgi:hypothetical protein
MQPRYTIIYLDYAMLSRFMSDGVRQWVISACVRGTISHPAGNLWEIAHEHAHLIPHDELNKVYALFCVA